MATLENLTPSSLVRGVAHDAVVEVVNVKWFGDSAIELTYKIPTTGNVGTRLLYRDDEAGLDILEHGLPCPSMGTATSSGLSLRLSEFDWPTFSTPY